MKEPRRKTGTREWAEVSKNLYKGCSHGCLYCYACSNALRYRQIPDKAAWGTMTLNKVELDKPKQRYAGRIMFPTAHDMMPEHMDATMQYLKGLLEKGNSLLLVSKPHYKSIYRICDELSAYKDKIVFRFTIGSRSNKVLSFWEPNAPDYDERLETLIYAHSMGFTTSVSCEPFLDGTIAGLVEEVLPYVTDTVWVGKMNRIGQRVDTTGWKKDDFAYLEQVKSCQTDEKIRVLYEKFKDNPKVKWKDSIKQVLNLPEEDVG